MMRLKLLRNSPEIINYSSQITLKTEDKGVFWHFFGIPLYLLINPDDPEVGTRCACERKFKQLYLDFANT